MDTRRKDRYAKQKNRFKSHNPRTMKDRSTPRTQPAENRSGGRRNRAQNKRLAEQTMQMLEGDGHYSAHGTVVDLTADVANAIRQTVTYSPEESMDNAASIKIGTEHDTQFEVELETTLAACQRLRDEYKGLCVGVLNFASAKNPGGGFLNGSMAQEESLAIASAMYVCIKDSSMYLANTDDPNRCLYQHYMICSPDTPVFRDDNGEYLPQPYNVTFLTVPAVNAGVARKKGVDKNTITTVMRERMDQLLAMAVWHKVDVLILGSWGCGVFGGDIEVVASMFIEFLTGKYEGAFQAVSFSTLDESHQTVFERELDAAF